MYLGWANFLFLAFLRSNEVSNLRLFIILFRSIPTRASNANPRRANPETTHPRVKHSRRQLDERRTHTPHRSVPRYSAFRVALPLRCVRNCGVLLRGSSLAPFTSSTVSPSLLMV